MIKNKDKLLNIVVEIESKLSADKYLGYDPYDGLNSEILKRIPQFSNYKYFKIAWIQFFKLSKINFRKLFLIDKGINPKGMGLILSSYVNLM